MNAWSNEMRPYFNLNHKTWKGKKRAGMTRSHYQLARELAVASGGTRVPLFV